MLLYTGWVELIDMLKGVGTCCSWKKASGTLHTHGSCMEHFRDKSSQAPEWWRVTTVRTQHWRGSQISAHVEELKQCCFIHTGIMSTDLRNIIWTLNPLRTFSSNGNAVCARGPWKVWAEEREWSPWHDFAGQRAISANEWMNEPKELFCFRRHSTTQFKFKCKRNHSLEPHPKSTITAKHPSVKKKKKDQRNFPTWYLNVDGCKSTHVNKCNAPQEPLSGRFYFPHLGGLLEGWGVTLFRVTRALMLIGKMKRNRRGGVWISDDGKSDSLPRIGSFEQLVRFFYVLT